MLLRNRREARFDAEHYAVAAVELNVEVVSKLSVHVRYC